MRLEQLDPDDASLQPTAVLVLSKREQATVRAMRRIVADLERIGYPGSPVVATWLELLAADGDDDAVTFAVIQ